MVHLTAIIGQFFELILHALLAAAGLLVLAGVLAGAALAAGFLALKRWIKRRR